MRTNNENRRDGHHNSHASRDGKSFERRDGNKSEYNRENRSGDRPSFNRENRSGERPFNRENRSSNRPFNRENRSGERPFDRENRTGDRPSFNRENRSGDRPFNRENRYGDKPSFNRENRSGDRPFNRENRSGDRPYNRERYDNSERPSRSRFQNDSINGNRFTGNRRNEGEYIETRFDNSKEGVVFRKRKKDLDYNPNAKYTKKKQLEFKQQYVDPTKPIRLNKFLANAGIASRREADEFIQAGVVSVNDLIVTELGTKVLSTDKVMFHNQPVKIERKVYLLLNKPKDYVTTVEDTHERKTVMDLVKNACSERIYPVGRLDRNTTGLLLLTNDGELTTKLTHPKYEKKKIYHVTLERDISPDDFNEILSGVNVGDFRIKADALEFVKENDFRELGIEIHSGQNRIVRRIFDTLGYKIFKLDRVYFAGLTKKNLPRGKYRFLTEREVGMLQMGAYE